MLTTPVSTSTETSAICTPPTPAEFRSPCPGFTPWTVMGSPPIIEQACLHVTAFFPPVIWPPLACRTPDCTPRPPAILAKSACSASTDARLTADPIPPTVPLPPDPAEGGY